VNIVIDPKTRKILITIMVIALLIIGVVSLRSLFVPHSQTRTTSISLDAQAAVNAVTAFYTLDDTESPDAWVMRVCTFTTDAGCRATGNFYAPVVLAMVEKNHIQSDCTAVPVRLVTEDGDSHIWEISVTMNHPWQGLNTPRQDVFVEVEKVDGSWLMNRILFQQETGKFITPTP
jgi:hypothetical protein